MEQIYVTATSETTIVDQCAQELFSLFIFAIAAEISHVGGETVLLASSNGGRRLWDNTLLTALADEAVWANLAPNLEEALTLVIPAFAHHNLLPEPEPDSTGYTGIGHQGRRSEGAEVM